MIKRTLYFGNPCMLSLKNKQLLLRFPELEKHPEVKNITTDKGELTFPIEDLGMIMLDHQQITITHALIAELMENNVAIVTCNASHHPTGLHLALHSNTLQSERYKEQIAASEPLKKQLWSQIIQQKIINQAQVLKKIHPKNNIDYLIKLSKSVKSGDSTNREAVAASAYWSKIFPFIENFVRHREGPPPNNLLNYGYAILRATMARSLVEAGLLPTLGIHHHNRYNAYCLADDMMEPYQPFVDLIVYNILIKYSVENYRGSERNYRDLASVKAKQNLDSLANDNLENLTKEIKTELLSVNLIDCEINGETSPLQIATQKTAHSLQKCFEKSQRKLLLPEIP